MLVQCHTIVEFRKVEDKNPYLLIAYIYHLYMGLFSGGQVLRAKVLRKVMYKKDLTYRIFIYFRLFVNKICNNLSSWLGQKAPGPTGSGSSPLLK